VSRGPASRLGSRDFKALLGFLAATRELELDLPYPSAFVAHLAMLVERAHPLYRENDLAGRRSPVMVDADGKHEDDEDELYWTVGPCAITRYRSRTADLSAARLSDVVAWRRYRESPIHREYFAPNGVGYMLDLGLPASPGWQRTLLFCKSRNERDFSERDRDVLEMLRPHLRAREARAALRRRLLDESLGDEDSSDPDASLTLREREIVFLAAQGKTNAHIAAELWITSGTVKKHLENVYLKLGVCNRAAAANRVSVGSHIATWARRAPSEEHQGA
jgi:DNA-binding CsgD family transcriptional regulator